MKLQASAMKLNACTYCYILTAGGFINGGTGGCP